MTGEAPARGMAARVRIAAGLAWRAHPGAAAGSAALAVLTGAVPVLTAWLVKAVLDGLAHHRAAAGLLPDAVGIGVLGLLTAVLPALTRYAQDQLRRSLQLAIVDRLFRAVNARDGLRDFENPVFHNQVRMAQDAGRTAPEQIVRSSLTVAQSAITMTGFLGSLVVISPVMAVIVVVSALPSMRVEFTLSRRRASMMWGVSGRTRRQFFFASLLVSPDAAKEIRLFGLGDHLRLKLLAEQRAVNDAEQALARRTVRGETLLSALSAVVSAGGLIWAVERAASGGLSLGDVTVFVAAIAGIQSALGTIVGQAATTHNALLVFGHYLDVVAAPSDLPVAADPHDAPDLRDGIELRDVWFRYDESQPWVLQGVDLFLPAGRSTALVGLNGAGKSTLVKLLCRMYDPTRGAIVWDGVDLRDLRPADLRARIGTVFQDSMRYDLTAAENIQLGDLAADDPAALRQAAAKAGIHAKLAALPEGYDTLLSRIFVDREEDNRSRTMLSGGEWQRLALARALMRDKADLLILDEPSSGLDAEAEHAIHENLRRLRAGKTSLLISHRLGAVREADGIVVLRDGRIVERGTHGELIAAEGEYARLFTLQAQGYAADAAVSG